MNRRVCSRRLVRRFAPGMAAAIAILLPLVACAMPFQGLSAASGASGGDNPTPYPIFSPAVSSGQLIIKTISAFCSAVHAGNDNQAYTYLSSQYKRTITRPPQIPDIVPRQKFLDCQEWGQGDFLKINGVEATDQIMYTVKLEQLGSLAQAGGSMNFVQEGSAWKIDAIIIPG